MYDDLTDVEVGEIIVIVTSAYGAIPIRFSEVTRITKTMIYAANFRFRFDGRLVGRDDWTSTQAYKMSQKWIEEKHIEDDKRLKAQKIKHIRSMSIQSDISQYELDRVIEILSGSGI
ncbi:MAG: hypothetical protein KAR20_27665 [Candidatus Heimdallarchaeota archaeon]|nr:hypothetical protein [Candidatus Heimdallarchaeota archaeon]